MTNEAASERSVNLSLAYSSSDHDVGNAVEKLLAETSPIEREYLHAGMLLGRALSYAAYGKIIGLDKKVKRLAEAEERYAAAGYRPISISRFVDLGGWGKDITDKFKQARDEGEEPEYHAAEYLQTLKDERNEEPTAWNRILTLFRKWYS